MTATHPPRRLALPLYTERLILRRFTDSDLDAFVAYRSDPEVARFQSWKAPYDPIDGALLIAAMKTDEPGTPGQWYQIAIERTAAPASPLIGDCAFCVHADRPRHAEIGFTLARAEQGAGFATEAVGRLVGALFDDLGMERVQATCDTENAASIRLLERLGMKLAACFFDSYWDGDAWRSEYAYAIDQATLARIRSAKW